MEDENHPSNSKTNAIILVPNKFIKKEMWEHVTTASEQYGKYDITVVADDEVADGSPKRLYDYLSALIESFSVPPLVVPTHDIGSIVHAALALKFPHIRAPSLESELLCLHKGETYKLAPGEATLPFLELSADAVVDLSDLTKVGLDTRNFPMFVKSSFGTNSNMVKKVGDLPELNNFIASHCQSIAHDAQGMSDFVFGFLSDTIWKTAFGNTWVVQPYVEQGATLVAIDGLVCQGKATPWNIHEFVFWENNSSAFKCLASPVDLSVKADKCIQKVYQHIAKELISHGFDNQFLTLEAFITSQGKVSIVEVNGRTLRTMLKGYIDMYGKAGDNVRAMLQIAQNEVPRVPIAKPDVHICIGYVCLTAKGIAKDFVNFDAANSMAEIALKVTEDDVISQPGEWGHQVAYCYTSGKSREDAIEKCRALVAKIILTKDKCMWLTNAVV